MSPAAVKALADGNLENFVAASTPGGIEAQEKRGQDTLCSGSNDLLPIRGTQEPANRKLFESMGFKFADKPEDELFISARFPSGWKKVATEHSMWSKLVDDKGRNRASIFYKAAFYDRSAHINLEHRFSCGADWTVNKDPRPVVVKDGANVIHTVGMEQKEDWSDHTIALKYNQSLRRQAEEWLNNHYPNWTDPTAYWE